MTRAPKKSVPRTSLRQMRAAIHQVLDDIGEWNGFIADEYLDWVYDRLHEPNDPIQKLFDRAGLDSSNQKHWVALLSYVVEAVYTERRGAPVVWSVIAHSQLVSAAYQIHVGALRKGKAIDNKAVCRALMKDKRFGYLERGIYKGSKRSEKTILSEFERALTSIEDEFRYPARRKDLNESPKLRSEYEKWLDTFRPGWRTRLIEGSARRTRKRTTKSIA